MPKQDALQDNNQVYSMVAASGTAGTAETRRVFADNYGFLGIRLWAEDADSPGAFVPVKGQYDSNGNFVLMTNGSGGGTTTPSTYYLVDTAGNQVIDTAGNSLIYK